MRQRWIPAVLLVVGAAPAWGVASGWVENGPSRVRLISPYQVAAEGEVRLGVEVRLEKGWHSYWKNSGDAGYAPAVEVRGVEGVELLYPAPHRFDLPGGLVAFGYEDEVVYPLRGRLRADGRGGTRIVAEMDYVVCAAECIPYRASLALDQAVGRAVEDAEMAAVLGRWWEQVPVPVEDLPGVETRGALVAEEGGTALEVRVEGAAGEGAEVFFESHDVFEMGRPVAARVGDGVVFRVPLAAREAAEALPARIPFAWTVTGLSLQGRRLAIEARREVEGTIRSREAAGRSAGAGSAAEASPPGAALLAGAAAVAATVLALYLWGILGPAPAHAGGGRGWRPFAGFAAIAGAVGALLWLARMASRETPAAVELALLGLGLCAWLRRRTGGRGIIPTALTVGLVACAGAALWLAHRGQL